MQAQELRADLDRAEQRSSGQLEGPTSPAPPSPASPDSACSMSTPLAAPERLFREASASPAPTPPMMPMFPGDPNDTKISKICICCAGQVLGSQACYASAKSSVLSLAAILKVMEMLPSLPIPLGCAHTCSAYDGPILARLQIPLSASWRGESHWLSHGRQLPAI